MRGKLWLGAATMALMIVTPAAAQQGDPPGDASTQAQLSASNPIEGEIAPAGDTDWFRLSVAPGQRYTITLDAVPNGDGAAIDTIVVLYDAQGNQLALNDDAGGTLNSALSYAPSAAGEVFVEARGFSGEATGAYRLSVASEELPPDDVANDASTRTVVRAGRPATGMIEYDGDVDWRRLDARTGQRYRITLNSAEGRDDALADPFLRVLDPDGAELAVNDDADGLNSAVDFIPQRSGPVFVEARAFSDTGSGAYTLTVTAAALPRDNASGDRSTRGRISAGQSVDASLEFPGDRDWYRIRLSEGQSYRLRLASAEGEAALDDPLLRIYGSTGEEIAVDDDSGGGLNSFLEFTAPATGVYYIEATGFNSEATGAYRLSAAAGDIPADASTDAVLSADGDFRQGELGPAGDRDWYRLDLGEGQGVRIGLNTAETGGLADPYVVVYSADGGELVRDDDGGEGLNSWLEFTATGAGAYYVEVRGFTDDAAGRYVLSITQGEIGDTPDGAEYLDPMSDGRTGTIGAAGDVDWFAVAMVEGRPYRLYAEGADPEPLADPLLKLYDQQGNEVAMDDDGGAGLNSYLNYTSVTGGVYFAAVSSYDETALGRYALRVVDTDVPGSPNTDEYLDTAGDERIGRIDIPGDADVYRIEAEQGATYLVEASGDGESPLADPHLAITDFESAEIVADDNGGPGANPRIRFAPPEGGTYFVRVTGARRSVGGYRVTIARQ